jgi:hypothetical protein
MLLVSGAHLPPKMDNSTGIWPTFRMAVRSFVGSHKGWLW